MKVLLIGSGGREHALAWKISQSPLLECLYILPGNPGTALVGTNLPGNPEDLPGTVNLASQNSIDLVVIGPEVPLAAGLADALLNAGIPVFGPSKAAAQIEASKSFAKDFMRRHNIPTAQYRTFEDLSAVSDYLHQYASSGLPAGWNSRVQAPGFVIKASGLAAGKGVFLPETLAEAEVILRDLLVGRVLGEAGRQVIIEERLSGPEVSVLAFTDGVSVLPMPPAQDHKRLLDADLGPNTGGMGAFAPSPLCSHQLLAHITQTILQPAVDGLRLEGRPFAGVLYAGIILTPNGPKVLEYNARFGDPETQVILPLLESDLLPILQACAQGRLSEIANQVRWERGAAAIVILASEGYPGAYKKGVTLHGLHSLPEGVLVFHAGTMLKDGQLVSSGGRVLGVAAKGLSLDHALERVYGTLSKLHFPGMHYRSDIGREFREKHSSPSNPVAPISNTAYAQSGVSIQAGNQAVSLMRSALRSTYGPEVLSDIGSFGGLFHAAGLKTMDDPVLVASTDGVGTKVILAAQAQRYAGIGQDIVNHCINDILVQGARPLFFLDYYAGARLHPETVMEIVTGMSMACRSADCAIIGGETAEMPGVYLEDHFDVAGTLVGVVERSAILPRPDIQPGDLLLGLSSSGPHTNGYSLIRRIFQGVPLETHYPELNSSLADALLVPHRSYLPVLEPLLSGGASQSMIKALIHITGGGFFDNIPRVLPKGCGVRLKKNAWNVPPIFRLIQSKGQVSDDEMYHIFNMGIGMVIVLNPKHSPQVQASIHERTWQIGEVIVGNGVVLH
jgi:phosphoribosylamine--glycine ligase/phosphoribosylformylglycinamidine cyclo-ligase